MRAALATSVLLILARVWIGIEAQSAPFPDVEPHESIESLFKYGSIGAEARLGVPLGIWRALPQVCPDLLPRRPGEGYARFGFIFESADARQPVGTTLAKNRVQVVGLNCATCHAGTVRDTPSAPPRVILGMPAHGMDLQSYLRFLIGCVSDPRFTSDTVLEAMKDAAPEFGFFDRLFYRLLVIDRTRRTVADQAENLEWTRSRPPQGVGRVDTFNPYKVLFQIDMKGDDTVGTADLPSLWNQRMRESMWLHWDGNNNLVDERNKSAAIGAGACPESLNLPSMDRIAAWIRDAKPPAFPKEHIDAAAASAGAEFYRRECASCHEAGGERIGQTTAAADLGVDLERLKSFTPDLARAMNDIGSGRALKGCEARGSAYPWRFSHFRKTDGYANMPLDGVWLRAPYLHNGSVPTLRALLFPQERPAVFYRGYDVYDWQNVGFVSSGPEAEKLGVRFDTSLKGNAAGGHVYGAALAPNVKLALLEYLKTL